MNDTSQITPKPNCVKMFTQAQMESYAKTQSTAFYRWLRNSDYDEYENCGWSDGNNKNGKFEYFTLEQMYSKFMEEQSK